VEQKWIPAAPQKQPLRGASARVMVIPQAGGRRALDKTRTRYGTDSINESWFQIGSSGKREREKKDRN
jgi:hypothetical protein